MSEAEIKILAAFPDLVPSGGYDLVDEVIGLLRVSWGQRDDSEKERLSLRRALDVRNEIEGKAHALFTEPLSNGQTFAHLPEQCNPLGFVQVLRAALEDLSAGKTLSKPFIFPHQSKT